MKKVNVSENATITRFDGPGTNNIVFVIRSSPKDPSYIVVSPFSAEAFIGDKASVCEKYNINPNDL